MKLIEVISLLMALAKQFWGVFGDSRKIFDKASLKVRGVLLQRSTKINRVFEDRDSGGPGMVTSLSFQSFPR